VYRLDHLNFHLRRLGIRIVLDVGANTGQFAKELRLHGYHETIISFEPLSEAHAKLEVAAHSDPLWKIAPRCAVGAKTGSVQINIAANSFSSSLLPMLDSHRDAAPGSRYVGSEQVEMIKLGE
jgi:FkbM family methyltransferase